VLYIDIYSKLVFKYNIKCDFNTIYIEGQTAITRHDETCLSLYHKVVHIEVMACSMLSIRRVMTRQKNTTRKKKEKDRQADR
jgi:hypothetical protein